MTVRVNLLPREFEARNRERRFAGLIGLLVLAWIGLLAFLLLGRLGQVDDAIAERDQEQATVQQLQAQAAALSPFQAIANELNAGNDLLNFAMGTEVSWAELLNDVALTVPSTTSLTSLQGTLIDQQQTVRSSEVFVENEADDVGVFLVEGYSIERFAPGVEAVLLRFGAVENFFQQYLTTAVVTDIGDVGVTSFTAEVRLDSDARTERYLDGLPEAQQ